ncbi:uroporphyrinogen-III C-methyltransferase [Ramlibacter sp.]|uniref:uroporphyrinogen-III C-methyltransferase n=1 Tax=Ramlibacter sp. TaxID=1917967 RepID=UPI003D10A3E3
MSSETVVTSETPEDAVPVPQASPPAAAAGPDSPRTATVTRATLVALVLLAGAALLTSVMLWQKLSGIQEQLARQSADSGAAAIEARALARQAQEVARDSASRQALLESRLNEVALQRTQLEELMQSLSRSRDENLVVDVESALRLAQQQMQLTGSAEPLLAALRTAEQRLARAAEPRFARVRAAITRDSDRIKSAGLTDLQGVLARLDELTRQIDELPAVNAVPRAPEALRRSNVPAAERPWWQRFLDAALEEARGLVRVSRIDQPEGALLAPEQVFFLRENIKLKLLNARLSLLARQIDVARADVSAAALALPKYFDGASRRTQAAAAQLQQVQAQLRNAEMPRIDETLAALATVAGGR